MSERNQWVECLPGKAYASFNLDSSNCNVEVSGSTIIILPKDGGIGWRFQPHDIGYANALRLAEETNAMPRKD